MTTIDKKTLVSRLKHELANTHNKTTHAFTYAEIKAMLRCVEGLYERESVNALVASIYKEKFNEQ